MRRQAVGILILAGVAGAAWGARKFTAKLPPEYRHPLLSAQKPAPRSTTMEYVDVGVLAGAILAASYFALVRRSRKALFGLTVASLAYFGFYRQGCVCPIGAIQNVAAALCDPTYVIPLPVVAFFVLPLAATLLFGRTFCASVCPLGAVQDLTGLLPIALPRWLCHVLGLLAWAYLGLAVLFAATDSAFIICQYDPYVAFFRLDGSVNMLIFGLSLLVIGVMVARPYCRFLCPYGAILRLVSTVAKWHVAITPGECIRCRLCEDSCPYDAINKANVAATPPPRREGRRRLAAMLVLVPLLAGGGGVGGRLLASHLARMHRQVRLAERVHLERAGKVTGMTDASEAFYKGRTTVQDLYAEAQAVRERFAGASAAFGAFLGLVIGLKLVNLSVRRTRQDYEPDRATCMACGRCFRYCPIERKRLEKGEVVQVRKR